MSDDRAGSRVAAVLEGLALQNASGELEIDGSPGGAIYLDRGEITFARAAWSPDLATRLRGRLGQVTGLVDLLAAEDRPGGNLGSQLVRRGYLSAAELESMLRSVVLDAIIVLTVPLSDAATVGGIRLVSDVSHWAGEYCRLNVAAVRAEAARHGGRMTGLDLVGGARLELRDLAGGAAVLSQRQWQLAGLMNGSATARDLAWDNGLPLDETAECVGAMVGAGLCAAVAAAGSAQPAPAPKPGGPAKVVSSRAPGKVIARGVTTRAVGPGDDQASALRQMMQRRRPAVADAGTADGVGTGPDGPAEPDFTAVSVESLRRVLDGLRQLS
jgi:hypothetical protein